jgi:7-cyano-7-deazaguanine synthase in queuosine biosynthesis
MSMDNQHQKIAGYRDLTQQEIDAMNKVKAMGTELGKMIDDMVVTPGLDQRWVSLARTHLQQGIMAAVRAIAQPTTF